MPSDFSIFSRLFRVYRQSVTQVTALLGLRIFGHQIYFVDTQPSFPRAGLIEPGLSWIARRSVAVYCCVRPGSNVGVSIRRKMIEREQFTREWLLERIESPQCLRAYPSHRRSRGANTSTSNDLRTISRNSSMDVTSPAPIACVRALPAAVASAGPAITVLPVTSAAS